MTDLPAPPVGLIDLGLLTRILCHEINNQLANQRGYTSLLLRRGGAGPDGERWLEEIAGAGRTLEGLVQGVQTWMRSAAFLEGGTEAASAHWAGDARLAQLAGDLAGRGCPLSFAGTVRVLAILTEASQAAADAWCVIGAPAPMPDGALLGSPVDGLGGIWLELPWQAGAQATAAWRASAERILPEPGAASDSWQRSLVLGLLRQSGGELFLPIAEQGSATLFLPQLATM